MRILNYATLLSLAFSIIGCANINSNKLNSLNLPKDRYIGEYKDGQMNGNGTLEFSNGNKYDGEFKYGNFNGIGKYYFSNGDRYEGEFSTNQRNGWGTFYYANGERYVGEWFEGKKNGQGSLYASNGLVKSNGNWVNDNLKTSLQLVNLVEFRWEKEIIKLLNENINLNWDERVIKTIKEILKNWLEEGNNLITTEVQIPSYPETLKLTQEKWESNKEFEDKVALARVERQKEIDKIQNDYRIRVEKRNADIQKFLRDRNEKEKDLAKTKNDLIKLTLSKLNLKIIPKKAAYDPEKSILYLELSIDNGKSEKYEYTNTPLEIRRTALTDINNLKLKPEFSISENGQFSVKSMNIFLGEAKVTGIPTLTEELSQTSRISTIDLPITNIPLLMQQSAIMVDRNQVEQILYRDENELLRKRLEDQRRNQELALSEQIQKASAESDRLKNESEALRQRQRELELQLASTSQTQINYGRILNAHALVIGNGAYSGNSKLLNPINDAKAISEKLRGLGFKVTESLDADRVKLVTSLSQFSKTAANADITLLFYAGHGVQISGTNYMLPIDLNLNDLSQVPLQGVSLNSVVEQYLPGKTKLVFLDACRDNPLMQVASRSVSRGLAPINVSEGTLIAYSTKDGATAQDGTGKNSPFTSALLDHLNDPDDIAVVLRKVREDVLKNTGNKQQPWEYGSLTGGALVLSAIKPK